MRTGKHIAMIGTTTPSHIYPSLGVIAELVRRGHRVSYAVGDRLAELVEPTGAELVTHPTLFPLDDGDWPDNPAAELATQLFLREAQVMLPRLVERFRADRPDLLLYDIGGQAAPLLSTRLGVPAVLLAPTWVTWEGFEQESAAALDALRTSVAGKTYHAAFTDWLRENGVEQDAWDWMGAPRDTLALIPRTMQPFADRVRANVRFVGPCLDPARLAEGGWTPPDSGRRVLLVSLGTVYNDRADIYRMCVEAFADSDWHVVMAIGQWVDPAALGPLPAHVEVHRRVPQLAVLAAASAFVTHAGMGGCVESLWFGVPTVAIPLAAEQFGNAAVLTALGVGQQLAADGVTPAQLRSAVEAVAGSAGTAERLAEIQATVRAHGGIGEAADAVESFLSGPEPAALRSPAQHPAPVRTTGNERPAGPLSGGAWDIATSVGITALGVASARAIETHRPDALIEDPFAEMFVRAVTLPQPMPTTPEELARLSPAGSWVLGWRYMGVRTRYFDHCFERAWADGTRQAVILAAGLDARAHRLDWPAGSVVYEVDQPAVLEFKKGVLDAHGAVARCGHHLVPVDLRADWTDAVRSAGFDPGRPTMWLVEGLLPYLPAEAEQGLLETVHRLSAPGSRIAIEDAKKISVARPAAEYAWATQQWGVDLRTLVHEDAARDAAAALRALGWTVEVEPIGDTARRYGHPLDPALSTTVEASRFVTAARG